jgi:hypothetical protein
MNRLATLLLLPLLLVVDAVGAAPDSRGGPFQEGIEFAASAAALEEAAGRNRFDFLALGDLWVRVKVQNPPRLATLTLTFSTPSGTPFYEATLLYTSDPAVRIGRINGAPATTLQSKHVPGGYVFDYPVPVSGSVFQRYPKPGSWVVQARVESTETTLVAPLEVSFGSP